MEEHCTKRWMPLQVQRQMLELRSINSHYGKAHILHDVGFSLAAGEVVSLLGRNGAGKTTTVKSIMQLVKPTSGDVIFNNQSIVRLAPHQVAKLGIGYVPEERRIFTDLTVLENLEVGRQPPREGQVSWMVDRLFEIFPNLEERKNNRGKTLSGGEQQMLSIAPHSWATLGYCCLTSPLKASLP